MTQVVVIVLAVLIGVIAGLRALTAPAVVSWGAFLGWIDVDGKWSEWVAHPITVTVLTIFLVVELITDQLPKTPSRKTPMQFIARMITGGFAAAALGTAWGYPWGCLGAGLIGVVLGTMGGYELRRKLSDKVGIDLPVALTEDAIAVAGGFAIAALTAAL